MAFKKNKENFVCEHCGLSVVGDGYTNHCPACLWSKHVDKDPGDRAASCGGMMKPLRVEKDKDVFMIVHKCEICGLEKRNRVGDKDDFGAVVELSKKFAMDIAKSGA